MKNAAILVLVVLAGCDSPPPRDDTAVLARIVQTESKVEASERRRQELEARLAALEAATRPTRADDEARLAALEVKLQVQVDRIAKLEERLELLAAAQAAPPPPAKEGDGVTIVDRRKPRTLPAPGEVVKAVAAIDGQSFSFVRSGAVDLARLLGVETPIRAQDEGEDRRKRQVEAWGDKLDAEAAWEKARTRLKELLESGELSFTYGEPDDDKRGIPVYAHIKKKDGTTVCVNEELIKEGLALSRGLHPRRADFDKLEEEARTAKRGLFAGH